MIVYNKNISDLLNKICYINCVKEVMEKINMYDKRINVTKYTYI